MRRLVLSIAMAALLLIPVGVRAEDTPKAAALRKALKTTKLDVDWAEDRLEVIVDELKEKVPGLKVHLDGKGGVSRNTKLTYKGKGQTAEEVLNGLAAKGGDLGWYIISGKAKAYDGQLMITKSNQRGYEKGQEPK